MTIRIIGAGFGRTGTHSLKVALEQLLGGTCHHMVEVFAHPDEVAVWSDAAHGSMPDWHEFLAGYSSIVDWPGSAFWPELAVAFPDAPVLLSARSPESWWTSATNTIFQGIGAADSTDDWTQMVRGVLARSGVTDFDDESGCKAAFVANLERCRAEIAPDRLVEWAATDGWGPLCRALGVDVPDEPFPVTNTTEEFRAMMLGQPPE
jgi:Sulfotransferase domain